MNRDITDTDLLNLAHLWWSGDLNVGDPYVLESGSEVTVCAVEVGGSEPPRITLRFAPDVSMIQVSFSMPVPS